MIGTPAKQLQDAGFAHYLRSQGYVSPKQVIKDLRLFCFRVELVAWKMLA